MGSNVIKYGPATLARLVAELEEPITNPITNPAPIEHGLVMDEWSAMTMQSRLRCLARNLHDAAGCARAAQACQPLIVAAEAWAQHHERLRDAGADYHGTEQDLLEAVHGLRLAHRPRSNYVPTPHPLAGPSGPVT